jgi:hypothetical protein
MQEHLGSLGNRMGSEDDPVPFADLLAPPDARVDRDPSPWPGKVSFFFTYVNVCVQRSLHDVLARIWQASHASILKI